MLIVQGAGAGSLALDAADLAKLPMAALTQRQLVTSSASAASDRSTVYTGVLLRDILARVIVAQDGRPLDAFAGPLALRALGDIRPGPRHVRNLCALLVRR